MSLCSPPSQMETSGHVAELAVEWSKVRQVEPHMERGHRAIANDAFPY